MQRAISINSIDRLPLLQLLLVAVVVPHSKQHSIVRELPGLQRLPRLGHDGGGQPLYDRPFIRIAVKVAEHTAVEQLVRAVRLVPSPLPLGWLWLRSQLTRADVSQQLHAARRLCALGRRGLLLRRRDARVLSRGAPILEEAAAVRRLVSKLSHLEVRLVAREHVPSGGRSALKKERVDSCRLQRRQARAREALRLRHVQAKLPVVHRSESLAP